MTFRVAVPSWALGAGGTRFGRFTIGGEPRNVQEKLDDVAAINRMTGANRAVSLHVPWDLPDDPGGFREYAAHLGLGFDAMNSNTFQDHPDTTRQGAISYKFGSLAHTDATVREAAIEHNLSVIELGRLLGSTALVLGGADGTNYPGQASLRGQFERVASGLHEIHRHLPADWRLLIEHKPFEPAYFASVNNDWGSSLLLAQAAGDRALCLVDLGHHLPNANVQQVVSRLAMTGRLGGFHFNDAAYGDDDLTAGSIQPYRLFLVMLELLEIGDGRMPGLSYMLDQSNNLKDPIEDLIQSTHALQVALAQALCVDRVQLAASQQANDPARSAELLNDGFRMDVRPLVAEARVRNGGAERPLETFRASGYRKHCIEERGAAARSTCL